MNSYVRAIEKFETLPAENERPDRAEVEAAVRTMLQRDALALLSDRC